MGRRWTLHELATQCGVDSSVLLAAAAVGEFGIHRVNSLIFADDPCAVIQYAADLRESETAQ